MRRVVEVAVLCVCVALLLRGFGVEPYHVPTGSMAPTLLGKHRSADCPRCGCHVVVGLHTADPGAAEAPEKLYRRATCGNCGTRDLASHLGPVSRGDRVFVNHTVYAIRRPRRWEVIVFRLFGVIFVKRVVGLPGETLAIRDGDIYLDGELARKDLDTARRLAMQVMEMEYVPVPMGWAARWEAVAGADSGAAVKGAELRLDGTGGLHALVYRHCDLDSGKSDEVRDEYPYNAVPHGPALPVHDFLIEGEITADGGGSVLLGLCDGADCVVAEIPIGAGQVRITAVPGWGDVKAGRELATATGGLQSGAAARFMLTFVDRRVSLSLDGVEVLPPVDLPAKAGRGGVVRPALVAAKSCRATVRNFRLLRDIHYVAGGQNVAGGKVVPLGAGQYFVLGDNSPTSLDSRSWPDGGAVPAAALLGRPFLVQSPADAGPERAGFRRLR